LLYRDTVILAPQTETTGLVAYEKSTGKIRWRTGYVGRNWYSHVSPCLATLGGVEQVILLAQPSDPEKSPAQAPRALITAVAAGTGLILWTNATPGPYKIPIPQPLRVADDRLFITGGFGIGCVMFEVTCKEGQWESQVAFQNSAAAGFIHSPVLYRDRIYVMSFKEHGGKSTGLTCLNLTGESIWQTGPALQFDSGALLIADGMALVMHGKTGELDLFDLSSDGAKLLAKGKVLAARNNMVWAPMALSRGKLMVRDQHQMKCLDLKEP
jgi:outer membrane protein assembly factor BamB